jgi:hypothetical protein
MELITPPPNLTIDSGLAGASRDAAGRPGPCSAVPSDLLGRGSTISPPPSHPTCATITQQSPPIDVNYNHGALVRAVRGMCTIDMACLEHPTDHPYRLGP